MTAMLKEGPKDQTEIWVHGEKQVDQECQGRKEMLATWGVLEILVPLVTVE